MNTAGLLLVALAIAIGLVGIIVPILPGLIVVYAAIMVWAFVEQTTAAWVTLAIVTVLLGATLVVKYLWPVRRMRSAEVSTSTLLAGSALGIIGFFVIPVLGLLLGFVLGVFLAELARHRDPRRAWRSTVHAIKGAALSVGIELAGGVVAAAIWLGVVLFT